MFASIIKVLNAILEQLTIIATNTAPADDTAPADSGDDAQG